MKSFAIALSVIAVSSLVAHRDQARGQAAAPVQAAAPSDSAIRQSPLPLKPGDHGVGRMIADIGFTDLAGQSRRISEFEKSKAVAFVLTSTSCPLSKKYLPTVATLARQFKPAGVTFICVNPTASDKRDDMAAAAKELGDGVIYMHDATGALAKTLGAKTTTDAIVIDASRTVVFHGAVDDQYGLGYALAAPRRSYLAEALDAHLAGRLPLVQATTAPGCELDLSPGTTKPATVTYHNRISRIMQQHCVECHRDGGVAPFTLTSYDDVASHAGMIRRVVERGVMPPWFAADSAPPGSKAKSPGHASPWASDRSLAESEKADLLAWIAGGKPRGDEKDAARPRQFADGWLIGKPDAVFEFARAVPIKATGTMPYQNITVETRLPEDRWVQAIEVQPGSREVVHHVLVFVADYDKEEDDESARDAAAAERRGFWAAYVPGNSAVVYPDGCAKKLPKGAKLRFQMHYTPSGKATEDRTRIGVVYAKQPPKHEVLVHGIANARIKIPPHADNHRESASVRLPFDVQILAFMPHMHVRGKACRYEVTRADGGGSVALDIPRYDFNWQLRYQYFEPLNLARGDTIDFIAWYDNSDKNPANPDPSAEVRWGPQTFNEMHLGYIEYIVPGAKPSETLAKMSRDQVTDAVLDKITEATFVRLDANADGKLTLDEARKIGDTFPRLKRSAAQIEASFKSLDANNDGVLNKAEFGKLRESLRPRRE